MQYQKPENIRSQPFETFKQVYNKHWDRLLEAGSRALDGDLMQSKASLLRYYAPAKMMEISLYSFIKDKEKYLATSNFYSERTVREIKDNIRAIMSQPKGLLNETTQYEFFALIGEWLDILLLYLRDAGVVPLEEEDFEIL